MVETQLCCLGTIDDHTRGYIVNLNRWRPEQQPRPRIQTIAQRTPAVAPQKKSWRSQAQFFHQPDRPSATRTKRSKDTEEKLKTSTAASPSLTLAWGLRASSAHSREAESDSFLACAAEHKKRQCRRRARDDARRCSHLLPSVRVSRVFCEMLLFSDLIKFREQDVVSRYNPKPYFSTKRDRL